MLLETVGDYEFARDVETLKDETRNLAEEMACLRHVFEDMQKSEKEEKKGKDQDGKNKRDSDVRQLKCDLLMAIRLKDEGGGRFGDHPVLLDLLSLGYFPKASEETFILEYISDMNAGLI